MSIYGDKTGYIVHECRTHADRRTCKMIKEDICKYLLVDLYGLKSISLTEEPTKTIVHEAFCRAVDQFEECGYISLNTIEHIVRDEYLKAIKSIRGDKFNAFYDKYSQFFKETWDTVHEKQKLVEKRIMDGFVSDYMDIWNP